MGSVRARKEKGLLFFDFRYQGLRCREQTMLPDTAENRRKIGKVLKYIEAEITLGTFDYEKYFPNSLMVVKLVKKQNFNQTCGETPLFRKFAWVWFEENEIRWKRSYIATLKLTLNRYLLPNSGIRGWQHHQG